MTKAKSPWAVEGLPTYSQNGKAYVATLVMRCNPSDIGYVSKFIQNLDQLISEASGVYFEHRSILCGEDERVPVGQVWMRGIDINAYRPLKDVLSALRETTLHFAETFSAFRDLERQTPIE